MAGEIAKGMVIWVPCQVNSGPFPDERRVYVKTGIDEWFGFVNISELEKKVERGEDRVHALVLDLQPNLMIVGINGQSPASKVLRAEPSFAEHGTVQA
jgi:hypothetical protein